MLVKQGTISNSHDVRATLTPQPPIRRGPSGPDVGGVRESTLSLSATPPRVDRNHDPSRELDFKKPKLRSQLTQSCSQAEESLSF